MAVRLVVAVACCYRNATAMASMFVQRMRRVELSVTGEDAANTAKDATGSAAAC
jgi:hypothetical protein